MKRIIKILMAFYILMLVFAPCVDDDFSVKANTRLVVSTGTSPFHQDQHDCCTPFCTCSCCSAPCEVLKGTVISQNFFPHGTMNFFFDSRVLTRYDFTIWEPPKA